MNRPTLFVMAILAVAVSSGLSLSGVQGAETDCACMAEKGVEAFAPEKEDSKRPVRRFLSGLGKELGASADAFGKDLTMFLSVQDVDPYEKSAPTDKPYVMGRTRLVDGTMADIVKFPDKSMRVSGGFADGTYACLTSNNNYVVHYPNGVKGTMKLFSDGGMEIHRPDNSVTTVTKNVGGSFRMRNTKMGYMGEIKTDQTGLSYEFSSSTF